MNYLSNFLKKVSKITVLVSSLFLPDALFAQPEEQALPLPLTTLAHHIGISVNDVLASAEFYSRVFGGDNVFGEKEPALRYFISFQASDPSVDAGDVAIGKIGTAGSTGRTVPLIDHFAIGAVPHYGSAFREVLADMDVVTVAQASILFDNDNIPVQVAGAVDESMAAGEITPMPSLYDGPPLVQSTGFDHIMLRVSNLDDSADFYRTVFGIEPESRTADTLWYTDGVVRLGMRLLSPGEEPGVDSYGVKIAPFDRESLASELEVLGATILPAQAGDSSLLLRVADIDGLNLVLVAD